MLSDISGRLAQVLEKRRIKDKMEFDIKQVEHSLVEKTSLLAGLERQLKQEQVDVERMEHISLAGLFYSVLGSREQQVEKERQELLAAQLKYQQAKHAVEALQADQAHLRRQLSELRGVEEEYSELLAAKEDLLRRSNPQIAAALIAVSEQIADRNAERREIDEAITAAGSVLAGLDQVIASLESAEGWGTWDMLGGGMLSTAIKHSRIDDARTAAQDVQAKMNRFARELADVQRTTDLSIDIGGMDIFADYFFDSLIVDWIIQSKIKNSLEQSRRARERVAGVVEDLRKLRAGAQTEAQRLSEQRAALIEQA